MSDQDQPAPGEPDFDAEPNFDDPAFDDLRGLLAEVRVTEPVPAEVAVRLEATLGSLRDQRRADARTGGTVVVLRRRVGRALVAAAAVAALAAGTVAVVQGARTGSDGSDSAASAGGQADADKAAPEASDNLTGQSPAEAAAQAVAQLSSAHFARDAASAMRALSIEEVPGDAPVPAATPAAPSPAATPEDTRGTAGADSYQLQRLKAPPVTATPGALNGTTSSRDLVGCAGPAAPDAVTLPASLDGVPVALVFRPPTTSEQLVEAWSCDGSSLLASATVPR